MYVGSASIRGECFYFARSVPRRPSFYSEFGALNYLHKYIGSKIKLCGLRIHLFAAHALNTSDDNGVDC